MDEFEAKLHRTWVQLLFDTNFEECAAIAVDTELSIIRDDDTNWPRGIAIHITTTSYELITRDSALKQILTKSVIRVTRGHLFIGEDEPIIEYCIKLVDVEKNWKSVIKDLIVNSKRLNQGLISELVANRDGRQIYEYNGIKFASKSEIRIAQELETRKILFFPLPLAVKAETGNNFQDHREIDFLVCDEGVWGILEVAYHPDRYEKDAEKDNWFKKSGILCIQHYTAERCYKEPSKVITEFLNILAKHRR